MSAYLSVDSIELNKINHLKNKNIISPPIYDLAGVVNHSGDLNEGHYVAHVDGSMDLAAKSNPASDQDWFCFNDDRVSPSSIQSSCGPSAYMLFYRLRNNNTSNIKTVSL